jgi:pyruvate dehydrogenase complex dehydrogenase (E1) component
MNMPNRTSRPNLELDDNVVEAQEWLESLDVVVQFSGAQRCVELLNKFFQHARFFGV